MNLISVCLVATQYSLPDLPVAVLHAWSGEPMETLPNVSIFTIKTTQAWTGDQTWVSSIKALHAMGPILYMN